MKTTDLLLGCTGWSFDASLQNLGARFDDSGPMTQVNFKPWKSCNRSIQSFSPVIVHNEWHRSVHRGRVKITPREHFLHDLRPRAICL